MLYESGNMWKELARLKALMTALDQCLKTAINRVVSLTQNMISAMLRGFNISQANDILPLELSRNKLQQTNDLNT